MSKRSELYTECYLARCALLKGLAAYDEAGFPASQEIRGNLVNSALYLADFKQPPEGYDAKPVEGPEDWFGVL